jgi:hypothetical protein
LQLIGRESVPKSQVVDAQLAKVLGHPARAERFAQLSHMVEQLVPAHGANLNAGSGKGKDKLCVR